MGTTRADRVAAAVILVLSAAAGGSSAQNGTAAVRGRVVDPEGGGIPAVVVTITTPDGTATSRTAVSDVEGNFLATGLPAGADYALAVSYPGFVPVEAGPFELGAGRTLTVNLVLHPAEELTETVRVEAKGHVVDATSASTSASFGSEFIEGLALIGHDYQDVLALAPGVTDTDGDGNPNVHGARDTGLQYRLDGGNVTDPVSGTTGQNLNADIIEEIEIITAGASAEYGRADGGFANIVTKSGSNVLAGKASLAWQGRFLNGDGAGNNDVNDFERAVPSYRDARAAFSLGGPIAKDRLWYFASLELLDRERPFDQIGSTVLVTARGHYGFGKLTWQADAWNRLSLQVTSDPVVWRGEWLKQGVSPDSDYERSIGSLTPQAKWTATLSPDLLLESTLTHYRGGVAYEPVSSRFRPTQVTLVTSPAATGDLVQARYPCAVPNCMSELGERDVYVEDLVTGRVNGPFFLRDDDDRVRNALKTDLSYNVEDAWGRHDVRAGIEVADEVYADAPIFNPILLDDTRPFAGDLSADAQQRPGQVIGHQTLLVFSPLVTPRRAASFNTGFYVQDAWKPRANLSVSVGLRADREDMDSSGYTAFDPRRERRRAIALWSDVCEAARRQGLDPGTSNCRPGFADGLPPTGLGSAVRVDSLPPDLAHLARLDTDGNGLLEVETTDRAALFSAFTSFSERETENFSIRNTNVAPRLSVSWDPWADGRTRFFATWGRFYDRLFLASVAEEIGPDRVSFTFLPDPVTHRIEPGAVSRVSSTPTILQVDRGLRTPRKDEISIGLEREIASEWSVALTHVRARYADQLQDVDLNHFTCPQARRAIGIDPYGLCGDGGTLEVDRFGETGFAPGGVGDLRDGSFGFDRRYSGPNLAADLYTVSPQFDQVFRVDNLNASRYQSWELRILKRLHHNWQMQASYTWSEALGQAETYLSALGDDPATADDEEGYLDYDQRHVLKMNAVTRLPHEIVLGASVQYESGTPFSVVRRVLDQDSTGNVNLRTFYPSGRRNDQRNEAWWTIDGRLEKSFTLGRAQAAAYLTAENLLDEDRAVIYSYNVEPDGGGILDAERSFGRRFEIGCSVSF